MTPRPPKSRILTKKDRLPALYAPTIATAPNTQARIERAKSPRRTAGESKTESNLEKPLEMVPARGDSKEPAGTDLDGVFVNSFSGIAEFIDCLQSVKLRL